MAEEATDESPKINGDAEGAAKPTEASKDIATDSTLSSSDSNMNDNVAVKVVSVNNDTFDLQLKSGELFNEIVQVLLERDSTCHRTCFGMYLEDENGGSKRVDAFSELGSVAPGVTSMKVSIVPENYSVREVKIHLNHIRDILRCGSGRFNYDAYHSQEGQSPSYVQTLQLFSERAKDVINRPPDFLLPGPKEPPLDSLFPYMGLMGKTLSAVSNIALSPYNPPIGSRKLKGDVLYLDIDTVEKRRLYVTACLEGFYINASTEDLFKPIHAPGPKETTHRTLVELLNQASPGFRKAYANILKQRSDKNLLERLPAPYPVTAWCVPHPLTPIPDSICAEEASQPQRLGFEDSLPGQLRNWNEELQATVEMPQDTAAARLMRDRSVYKIHADFVYACVRGAVNILDGNVLPLNPGEEDRSHMYIWNDIFYSLGFDVKDHYKDFGGDAAAHVASAADLANVRLYANINVPKLHTLGMAVVDYRGTRIAAQSVIPGILDRDQDQSVIYGSSDFGKTILGNAEYDELLKPIAEALHLQPHKLVTKDAEGKEKIIEFYSSFENKGIIGNDGRKYLLDLLRTLPPDANYLEGAELSESVKKLGYPRTFCHKITNLRPEILEHYIEDAQLLFYRKTAAHYYKKRDAMKMAVTSAELQQALDKFAEDEKKIGDWHLIPRTVGAVRLVKLAERDDPKVVMECITMAAKELRSLDPTKLELRFNPDCFAPVIQHADQDELKKQQQLVIDVAAFLVEQKIPTFVRSFTDIYSACIDGQELVERMHNAGINVRYLGYMLSLVTDFTYVVPIMGSELLCRSVKHVMRKFLQELPKMEFSAGIALFLNCLFGTQAAEEKVSKKKKAAQVRRPSWSELTTKALWASIVADMEIYYGFVMDRDCDSVEAWLAKYRIQKVAVLRRVCRTMGIQICAKDYKLDKKPTPFNEEDILGLFPVFRHKNPLAQEGSNLLYRAKAEMQKSNLSLALFAAQEAVSVMNSVYGSIHPQLVQALRVLAVLTYYHGDFPEAFQQQYKALLINERCNGVDSAENIAEYVQLSIFAFALFNVPAAGKLIYRARYLLLIAYGDTHPMMFQINATIACYLYASQEYDLAARYLQSALDNPYVPCKSQKTALVNHMFARTQVQFGNFREALKYEKKAYQFYADVFGEESKHAVECTEYLKVLATQAVRLQKQMNDVANGLDVPKIRPLQPPETMEGNYRSILDTVSSINGIASVPLTFMEGLPPAAYKDEALD
ncbi:unnamed protein product, partial [Mesorhabditis spiculigera]